MAAKRIFGLLTVLMVFLSACGNSESVEQSENGGAIEGTVTVSAAASLTDAMNDIAKIFMEKYPEVQLDYNFGGSGALQQQIMQGAPVDLFFSASESHFRAVVEEGYIDEEDTVDLLANELVLIIPQGKDTVSSFDELDKAEQIAIGNPESVPAGEYSVETFESMGLMEELEDSFVYTEDVRAVLTYVETGNVDAGLVYRTDAETSEHIEIAGAAPGDTHDPIIYPVGLVNDPENPAAAQAFYNFIQSEEALEVFENYGFVIQ